MIDAHRGAFEYDWRARFSLPLTVVGKSMTWGEAWRLTMILLTDPASYVAAAVEKWAHPVSREALILMDSFDLAHHAHAGKRQKPHPMRPTRTDRTTEHRGRKQVLSQDEIIAVLRAAGHTAPLPV